MDGDTGKVVDMKTYGLLESASVKIQTLKTAIEVSGQSRKEGIARLTFSLQHYCYVLTMSFLPEGRKNKVVDLRFRTWLEKERVWVMARKCRVTCIILDTEATTSCMHLNRPCPTAFVRRDAAPGLRDHLSLPIPKHPTKER